MKVFAYLDPQYYTSVLYQIVFAVITFVLFCIFLYKPFVEFHPVGPSPYVTPVTQETIKSWGKEPARVNVGFHITDFIRFDMVKNDFIINAFIWFTFDPKKISPDIIDKFAFTKGDILQKSDAKITQNNGTTTAQYTIRVQFSTIVDYTRFPLDDHRLFLNLTNPAVSADQLLYHVEPGDYSVSENMYLSGWHTVEHTAVSGYTSLAVGPAPLLQPKAVFSLGVSKQDLRQLALILFPLLFLFYLGTLAFSIGDMAVNITLPITGMSGLLAYSFVIQTLAPAVGYFMLSDYLFLFFLVSSFLTFFVEALSAIPAHVLNKRTLERIEGMTILLLHIGLVVVGYYLTDVKGI